MMHQVVEREKANMQPVPSSLNRQNMSHVVEEVSVVDTSSIDKALNNYVVLRTIMHHLATKDLLNVRLVAKNWEEEATIRLLSTCQKSIWFTWNEKELKFQNNVGTLEEFTDSCYGNPLRKFPCSQFYFEFQTSSLNFTPALSKFFSNHGHRLKGLRLFLLYNSASSLEIVRKIVFEWTPNLKSLTLNGRIFQGDDDEDKPPAPEIKNSSKSSSADGLECSQLSLEHFEISAGSNSATAYRLSLLITDILSSAANLKTILDVDLRFTKEIFSAGKISAVQSLALTVYLEYKLARYIEFSQALPQLTDLEVGLLVPEVWTSVRDPPSDFLSSLQLILQSSRETLKTLKFRGRFDSLTGTSRLNIPVMENLQEFQVYLWNSVEGGQGRLLPEGFFLQNLFPRLKTLLVHDVGEKTTSQQDNPFGQSCNSSTTIEKLTIIVAWEQKDCFHLDSLRQARDLYPNVRVLDLDFARGWIEIPEICHTIWRYWNSVQELCIKLLFSVPAKIMNVFKDRIFNELDREYCRMLKKQDRCNHGLEAEKPEGGPLIIGIWEPVRRRQNLRVTINGVKLTEMI